MFDVFIYTVGYEQRSGYAVKIAASERRIGIVFSSHQLHSYAMNIAAAQARQDRVVHEHEFDHEVIGFESALRTELSACGVDRPRVCVDVSSMTGGMMAHVLHVLLQERAALSIAYTPAKYQSPRDGTDPFVSFMPLPGCEGWTQYPERPLSVVLGLGYEVDQAIGTVEYLDPSGVWAFVPHGLDPRFHRDVIAANRALWPILEPAHTLDYELRDPGALYAELRGLIETLSRRSRVTLVPVGPKLFTALCIIVRAEIGDEVAVWRASSHGHVPVRDVQAAGRYVQFDLLRRAVAPEFS